MEDIGVILSSNKKGERGKNGREVKENMEEMKRRKKSGCLFSSFT